MPICPVSGKSCAADQPAAAVGSIVKLCPLAKGAIWVHVLDDLGNNIKGVEVLKDGGSGTATDTNGLSTYDPLDAGGPHQIALSPLVAHFDQEYKTPDTTSQSVYVSDGQITYVSFELKRRMNEVKPTMTVDLDAVALPFPEAAPVAAEIHLFQPENKPADAKVQLFAVTLSYTETLPTYAFDQGGTFRVSGVPATLWTDTDAKTPLAGAANGSVTPTNTQLKSGFTFYVRLDGAGEATFTFALQNSAKDRVVVDTASVTKTGTAKAVNRITPYVRVEHLVVLRDRELWKEQRKNDTAAGSAAAEAADHIRPDATRIELSAAMTAQAPAYTGKGKLVLTPANAKVFTDETCATAFDTDLPIDFDKLVGVDPLKLYLQGTTAGKFTVELQMDASTDALVKVDGPAKGEMGCVELKLKLFHYKKDDVNKAVEPDVDDATTYWNELKALTLDQAEMTDAEKAGTGRVLHVQDANRCSRAKLVLSKVDAASWPDAAKDYTITLDAADADKVKKTRSGGVKLFTLQRAGDEKPLLHSFTLDDMKAADQTLWVEGESVCTGWRDYRLSVGFDRPAGGPAKSGKMDADWAAFTIVRIKEVKCDVGNEPGQEDFVEGNKVFINLDANGRVLKSVAGKRKADVFAQLEPALEDVDIYFSVVEHEDTYKLADLPADFKEKKIASLKHTLKPVDRADRKKLLHSSAKTDSHGKALITDLQMPQLGKLKFKIGAYLLQDADQARYIAEHPDLKVFAPALSSTWLEVWRRIFYRVIAMERWSGASYIDRFDGAAIEGKLADTGIQLKAVAAPVDGPYVAALPNYLPWARNLAGGTAGPRTMYLTLISGRDKGDKPVTYTLGSLDDYLTTPAPGPVSTLAFGKPYTRFRSTTDKAKWLTSITYDYDGHSLDLAPLTTLTQVSDFEFELTIDSTHYYNWYVANVDAAKADDFLQSGVLNLEIKEADSSSGVSLHEAVVVCMDTREPDHATQNAKDSASHTFLHEIGHYLGLAGKHLPDRTDKVNPNFYSEQAGEVSDAGVGGVGLGPHCDALGNQCIMWYSFKMTLAFCETCNMHLRTRALHSPKVTARNPF